MEEKKQKQTAVRRIKEDSLLGRVLYGYYDWLISTQAKCDCEWSSCLKKIFNNHNKKEIRTLRGFLYIQSHLPMENRNPFDPDLQFLVGVAYLCGWIPCKDNAEEAHRWFRRSADLGSPRGKMAIGYLHEKQLVAYHDEIAMLSNYSFAAFKGYAPAQYRLAQYYHQQTNPDREQIKDLLADAAAQDYIPAKYLLATLYPETVHNVDYREIYGYEWAEIARKHKEAGKGLYAPIEEKPDNNSLIEEISKDIKQILPIVPIIPETHRIVVRQEYALQTLQSSLNSMWAEMREAEEEFREKLQDLQREIEDNLNRVPKEEVAEAEKFMSLLFKDDWRKPDRLCNESCDALVTAHVLMKVADMLEIRNYAGIVITAVWALEHECRRRFRDSFDRYLASINIPEGERASRMNIKPGRDGSPEYTLGSISYVVNSPDFDAFSKATGLLSPIAEKERVKMRYSDAQMIWKYWLPGTWDSVSGKGKSFQSMIMMLNNDYRIPAAHAKDVGREEAEKCCHLLGITEAHKKMNNIAGALKALLWLTSPLE